MTAKIRIDFKSSTPIFQQIVNELERAILVGLVAEGSFLPSVREFAVANTVNPNTVAKAYQILQTMELAEVVRGKGLIVKKIKQKAADDRRDDLVQDKISELIKLGNSLHYSVDDLVQMLKNHGRKK